MFLQFGVVPDEETVDNIVGTTNLLDIPPRSSSFLQRPTIIPEYVGLGGAHRKDLAPGTKLWCQFWCQFDLVVSAISCRPMR